MNDKTKTVVLSGAVAAALSVMLGAVEAEAGVRNKAEAELLAAGSSAWSKVRDAFKGVLLTKAAVPKKGEEPQPGPVENARLLLDALRTACKAAKDTNDKMGRGLQYASDLSRAIKATEKGKTVPADLWKATRKEWTEAPFWTEAGILAPSGKKKGHKAEAKPEGENSEGGQSVADAAEAADKPLSELMQVVSVLHGPFRAEWIAEAKELAQRILKKQAASGGSGEAARVAVN